MANVDWEWLRPWTDTDKQRAMLDTVASSRTVKDAADRLGVEERNIYLMVKRLKKKAADSGVSPENGLLKPLPSGQRLKGVSELQTGEGDTLLRWVKSENSKEEQQEAYREFVKELCESVTPRKRLKMPKMGEKGLMVGYPIGDHHFGMYAYAAETGKDYDLQLAKDALAEAVDYLVSSSPAAEYALLANLGDYYHIDNRSNKTPQSGHILDVDTRYSKVIRTGAFGLAHAIERLLEKHKRVKIVNVPGNHDMDSASWLSLVMDAWFRNEPRVEVDTSPSTFLFHQFGKNMICMTHGDKVKLPEMPQVMASLRPEMWGATKYRVAWTGHIHHSQTVVGKENRGAIAESFGVLPPSDAYAASLGYHSQREMHAITFKESGGVLCRNTYNADLTDK